eukprot:TRINITY_DN3540_c0_g1_i2.p1 TRINITY_DN3540_c0_g1~~TRINITY_DN3540_c0_g1_i2.p1  ORF type:complete len:125 (-),score=9.15 TRINITY_DN3540_c0_g1_i2:53-427(-)
MTDPRWEFKVEILTDGNQGLPLKGCSKRYSDFQELDNTMCAELGEKAWQLMPQLPAAHTVPGIGKLFDTIEVAQQRRQELNQYLQDLMSVPGASDSTSLRGFLTLEDCDSNLAFESSNFTSHAL